ncbi:DUF1758 domain-containing protein [Trichonephila clavipes]|nr:DUF1758 domain-containing protein [Trichonephila clavipes]
MDAANQAILERGKKTRSVSRSHVTKQINKLESEISNSADKTVHKIYMQLISKFEELSTLDKEIESLMDIESLEDEIVAREEYRDKFIIWRIHAERKDISSFPSFWARFKSAVHENSSLNDVDKFSYLKSVVTSDAELAIRGLTLTSENYVKAVKILEDRFGRKELIVDFHMNRLLNLTPVRKSFDVIASRNLYDQGGVLLQCVKAEIIGRSSSDNIFCLFDNGSEKSFIKKNVSRRLGLKILVETSLGWSLQGKSDERSDCTSVHLVHSEEESFSAQLRRFWEIESLEILDKDSVTLGNGDEEILGEFDKSISFVDGQYRISVIEILHVSLSLFWTDNLNNQPYVLNFTRVLFGLRPSPYLLAATLKHHFKKYREQYPHTFELLNSSIYVDDLICGQNDVPDALRTTLECLQIFSDAGMLLRKWQSNSKQLYLLWQQEGVKTESSETSAIDLRPSTKVLGLAWDPEKDLIYFDPKDLLKLMSRREESKRFTLSVVGRIFDPTGILGSFVIKLKCLLQNLWTLGVDWVSELPPNLRHKWQQWNSEAEGLTGIKIPWFYLAFKPYFKNRVQEIQSLSDPIQWRYCPGKDNPADLLSRGTSAVKIAQNELWWHDPPWLKLTPDHWPNRHRDILDSELCSEELEHRSSVHVAITQQRESLVDINRFGSLKLLKHSGFQSFVADKGIHWKFIVERVPWWGGFYERLVKTIKDPLCKILGRALLTFEELSTILSEVEVIVIIDH